MPEVDLYSTGTRRNFTNALRDQVIFNSYFFCFVLQSPITLLAQHMNYKHWYDRAKMTLKEVIKSLFPLVCC